MGTQIASRNCTRILHSAITAVATIQVGKNIFVMLCTRCAVGNRKLTFLYIVYFVTHWYSSVALNLYNTGSSTMYAIQKQKDQLWSFEASVESVKCLFSGQMLKRNNLAQMKALFKSFKAIHSQGRPVTGPVIIRKAKFFMMKWN